MTNRKKQVSQNTENILDSQVVSKERVTNHGEVYTNAREVKAMLDLVKNETERIPSTLPRMWRPCIFKHDLG
jgi:hypothetical protein